MMAIDAYSGLGAFLAVAEHLSFTAAAARLAVTPTAVSNAVKTLEDRLGVILFQRTTRRVALTEAGARLYARVGPLASELESAFGAAAADRERPSGTLKLTIPRVAFVIVQPLVVEYRRRYPNVLVEISLEDGFVDLVAMGFDAGVRLGESIAKDMVAVPLLAEVHWAVVGAPAYLAERGVPKKPEDLVAHHAIHQRFRSSRGLYRWEFERKGRAFVVDVPGALVVDDPALQLDLALAGLGLSYLPDFVVREHVAVGRLQRILQAFLTPSPGLYLYFPLRSRGQPKLGAFVDLAREAYGSKRRRA